MKRIDATEVRRNFVDVADRVRYGREWLIVQRNGRDLIAMVPIEDALELQNAGRSTRPIDRAAIRRIVERTQRLPILDDRSPEEILGYSDDGLPS